MPSPPASPETLRDGPGHAARRVLQHVVDRPPTLGAGRLLCVDGPAGSGKTTLAERVRVLAPDAQVIHTDDLLEGWGGLPGLAAALEGLLRPLAAGDAGRWRRWDWLAGDWAEWRTVAPGELLVLEGVGSWSPGFADLVTALVWVEADRDSRLARGLARDGDQMRDHWLRWSLDEDRLHARLGTRDHADLVVDTRQVPG